jgi:hypothetical protein
MKETASASPALRPFLCADQSGTGDWSRNCLVTDDGGWHVTLAQAQSTGEPIQRVAGTMVDRIFCRFRNTRSVVTTRACLTSPDSESARASPSARQQTALPGTISSWPSECLLECVRLKRFVSISARSKVCQFWTLATREVARPPRASIVGLWVAGPSSFCSRSSCRHESTVRFIEPIEQLRRADRSFR